MVSGQLRGTYRRSGEGGARREGGRDWGAATLPELQKFASRSALGVSARPGSGGTIASPALAHKGHRWVLVACEFASAQKWNCAAIKMITRHNANTGIRNSCEGMYFI
jgi:hypothetical protein